MRHAAVILVVAIGSVACAPLPRPVVASSRPQLSGTEQAVIAAVLKADIESYRGERPVMLLDETSSWMPDAENELAVPDDFPRDEWLAQNPPVPLALRNANASLYSVGSAALVDGVAVFSRGQFERMNRSKRGLRALAKPFGGREPVVLEVSRPVIDEQGTAHALVHVYSTWNGCGGINMYAARREGGEWVGELKRVLVIW